MWRFGGQVNELRIPEALLDALTLLSLRFNHWGTSGITECKTTSHFRSVGIFFT
jgi:hypothetical protein